MNDLDPEDAIFLVDAFLDECKVDQHGHTESGSKQSTKIVWLDEDKDGQPHPKRCRAGEKRKRNSATVSSASATTPSCDPSTSTTDTVTIENFDSLIQDVRDLLGSGGAEKPLPSHGRNRQTSSLENWTVMRPFMVNNMLSSEKPKEGVCHHCGHKAAVVMCRDCLPRSLYCTACDLSTHEALVLHNRASMVEGFFRHLPPSTFVQQHEGGKFSYHEKDCMLPIVTPCCDSSTGKTSFSKGKPVILIGMNGRYNLFLPSVNCSCGKTLPVTISDLVESGYWPATVNFETLYMVDLFTTYEDLKITAPGMSRQAFVSMLECRTKLFGRSGKICGDTLQRAFLEWAYAKFEVDKLSQVQHFQCPACTPSMLAVSVDGNRKLYRFKSQPGPDGFFDGVFLANDAEVSSFVDHIHGTTGHNPGKGRCGLGQWTAARESANKSANKLDEEGVEVAVCRHGVLLKALNMFRGEIFAYPLYLQKQLASQTRVVDHCPEMKDLLNMRPFLSIMHAKAHSWMCEVIMTLNEGAGTTIGEEVEQVNSFLSRAAICSKYMSKAVRTDMLTIQASGWNKRKAENLDRTLAKRYVKTVQKIAEATKDLENLTAELSLQQDTVQQWTSGATIQNDLQRTIEGLYLGIKQRKFQLVRAEKSTCGNKRRHQLRKKIAVEKKALEVAINDHNASVGEVEKLPPPNELLAVDNYSWPWECHGDMERKKNVFDKVMMLTRLKEEEVIVVREVKQHMEYMSNVAGLIEDFTFQLTEDTDGKCSTEGLMEKGREGLLCVLKRRLCEVEAQLATACTTYKSILGLQTLSLHDFSEEEDLEYTSSTDEELE
ncbi:unnamed protein product [Leuciscus chuanchicus]